MERSGGEHIGAQRSHSGALLFKPYSHPQSPERHSRARITGSLSIPRLAQPGVLVAPNLPMQFSPISPADNLQVTETFCLPPTRRLIQQVLYVPARARSNFTPASPVLFSLNGVLGISVSQAVAEEYIGLDGRDNGVSSFERGKTSCRIQFHNCGPYDSKINTRHNNASWAPIKRSKLAKEVGRRVKAYIEEQGLQDTFAFERIYLTRLIQVSKGSWQPELYYDDPITMSPNE